MTSLTTFEFAMGFATPWLLAVLLLVLHIVVPAFRVKGYAHEKMGGTSADYRLNGLLVLAIVLLLWGLEVAAVPLDWFWRARWPMLIGATVLGMVATVWLVFRAPSDGRGFWMTWYVGRSVNVNFFGRVDVKMYLYLFGAVQLVLIALSSVFAHYAQLGAAYNPGFIILGFMWLWFVVDYFVFERVHLYTYDIFEERLGWKIVFGCIVIYPFIYPLTMLVLAELPKPDIDPEWQPLWLIGSCVIYLIGWAITRGANLQKYSFKRDPERAFLGVIKPESVSDGTKQILSSGFWRVARHFNYLGEILQGLAMALVVGHFTNIWSWWYFLFITAILVPRERVDDLRCAKKYGELWSQYQQRAPHRIIPGVY